MDAQAKRIARNNFSFLAGYLAARSEALAEKLEAGGDIGAHITDLYWSAGGHLFLISQIVSDDKLFSEWVENVFYVLGLLQNGEVGPRELATRCYETLAEMRSHESAAQ